MAMMRVMVSSFMPASWLAFCASFSAILQVRKTWLPSGEQKRFVIQILKVCPYIIPWTIPHVGAVDDIDTAETLVDLVAFPFYRYFPAVSKNSRSLLQIIAHNTSPTYCHIQVCGDHSIIRPLGTNPTWQQQTH